MSENRRRCVFQRSLGTWISWYTWIWLLLRDTWLLLRDTEVFADLSSQDGLDGRLTSTWSTCGVAITNLIRINSKKGSSSFPLAGWTDSDLRFKPVKNQTYLTLVFHSTNGLPSPMFWRTWSQKFWSLHKNLKKFARPQKSLEIRGFRDIPKRKKKSLEGVGKSLDIFPNSENTVILLSFFKLDCFCRKIDLVFREPVS